MEHHAVDVSASIGIAGGEAAYETAEALLHDADLAMYRAKVKGTGHFEIFQPVRQECAAEELATENSLR